MSNIKLRAHHGLCILFFEGKGYDDNFVNNMRDVIVSLSRNPIVTIVAGEDIVCAACPNNKNGTCDSSQKVETYDKAVLNLCDISINSILPWESYKSLVMKKIIETENLITVCGDCEWAGICLKISCQGTDL